MKKPALLFPEQRLYLIILLIAGALMTLAYAPFNHSWLVFILLAIMFYGWSKVSARLAFVQGWIFGLGMQGTGVSWIYYSLHYHGGSPPFLAVLMIFLLSAYLAIYPAMAAYLVNRFCKSSKTVIRLLLLYPVAWALMEWLQGIVMTGFAWMQPGYTQIDWPLAGYAPVLGNHGVGLLIALTAGCLVLLVTHSSKWKLALVVTSVLWLTGFALKQVMWTDAIDEPIRVSLIQGNIAQDLKWKREMLAPTLKLYRNMSLQEKDVDLIIWPETAVPGYLHRMQAYLKGMSSAMKKQNTDLLTGLFIQDAEQGRYYNGLINVNGGEYRKRHLVPLGEYIPLRFLASFFNRWIDIPMSDIASAEDNQPLLRAAGQPLGVSICFEDAFSRDVRKDLPEATMLVNVSNDAWFEDSHESAQHHAIARMRALETGRPMLRATNTGISAVIGPRGEVITQSPPFEPHVLRATVQPMQGRTPYIYWGDYLLLLSGVLVLGGFAIVGRKRVERKPVERKRAARKRA